MAQNKIDRYYKQQYRARLEREKEEAEYQKQINEEWNRYQEEEANKQAETIRQKEAEEKALREAEEEAQRQAEIQASKEAEEMAAKEAEERAAKHAVKQQELESVFTPEQKAINDGNNIIKQVSENPQNINIPSNVDDILKNQYKRTIPEEAIKARLIDSYNKHGFSTSDIDNIHTEALEINRVIDEEALVKSYLEWDDGFKGVAKSPIDGATTNVEDIKIKYDRWADNGKLKSTTNEVQEAINKAINSSTSKEEALGYIEQNFTGDIKYSSKRIINDSYEYVYEPIHADKIAKNSVKESAEDAAKNLKKSAFKNLGHVMNLGFAVSDFKDAREAGKSTGASLVHAGAEFAKGELLGGWYMAAMLAKSAPTMAVSTIEGLNTMSRSMNSTQRRQLFGDAQFMDTQQLATMRQSGMELAKMSQYNLQQTLMGSEAEYLHRL